MKEKDEIVFSTDTLQTFIMLIGGVVLTFVSLREVGGYSSLMEQYANTTANIWSNSTESAEKISARLQCAQPAKVDRTNFNVEYQMKPNFYVFREHKRRHHPPYSPYRLELRGTHWRDL